MMPFLGKSQITNQCPPDSQLKKILSDAKQRPVLLERIVLLNDDIRLLNQRIVEKEGAIADLKAKDANNTIIVSTYEREIAVMKEQRKVFEDQVNSFAKQLKREKRKRFWTAAGGVASIGIMAYLYITK